MATHDSNVSISLAFATLAAQVAGFSTIALIDSGSDLGGDRIRAYASAAEAAADTDLSSFAIAAAAGVFAQTPAPATFKVIEVDTTAPETYSAAFAAALLVDPDFYVVCMDARVPATIAALSATIESDGKRILFAQDDDGGWITNTPNAAYNAVLSNRRTVILYHETDADPAVESWASARLSYDVDQRTAGFEGRVGGSITPNDYLGITTAEKNFVTETNDANILLPFGRITNYASPGQTLSGQPISEIIAADWLRARLGEDLVNLKVGYDDRGEIIPVSPVGQAIVRGVIEGRAANGVQIGKFKPGQVVITFPTITTADITAQRIRAEVAITPTTPASKFVIALTISQTDVVVE